MGKIPLERKGELLVTVRAEVDHTLDQDHGRVQSRGLDLSQVLDLKVVLGQDQVLLNQDLEHDLGQVLVDQEHVLGQLAQGPGLDLRSQAQDLDREVQLVLDLGLLNQDQP